MEPDPTTKLQQRLSELLVALKIYPDYKTMMNAHPSEIATHVKALTDETLNAKNLQSIVDKLEVTLKQEKEG